jgi:hypothetical protein
MAAGKRGVSVWCRTVAAMAGILAGGELGCGHARKPTAMQCQRQASVGRSV